MKFRPHFKLKQSMSLISQEYTPQKVAELYSFPKVTPIRQVPIAVIELGGGFKMRQINRQFRAWNLPVPIIRSINVQSAMNHWHNGQGADPEVVLDIIIAAATYSYCTGQAARILVVFARNSEEGFIRAIRKVANHPSKPVCSISWGGPESIWTNNGITRMNNNFSLGNNNGVTYFCASGDQGSSDGLPGDNVDFPGSSPFIVCCGGTTLTSVDNEITSEVVWNNDPDSATGGGVSTIISKPAFQSSLEGTKRFVNDLSGNADPNTGYTIPLGIVGGTSCVSPLYAGLFAAINSTRPSNVGFVNQVLYDNPSAFRDITSGNNGTYSAGVGWDICSGLGVPIGSDILSLF